MKTGQHGRERNVCTRRAGALLLGFAMICGLLPAMPAERVHAEEEVPADEAEVDETETPAAEGSAGDGSIITVKLDNNAGMMLTIECTNANIARTREEASDGQFYWDSNEIGFKLSDDYYPENLTKKGEGYFFAGWEIDGVSGEGPYYDKVTSGACFKAKWIGADIGNWESQPYHGGVIITGAKNTAVVDGEIYIPKTINGTPVVEISKLFEYEHRLDRVYLPEGISLERLPSFSNTCLKSICTIDWQGERVIRKEDCLPESIKEIEHNTFSGTYIRSLAMPGVTHVEGGAFGAFENCGYLKSVSFGKAAAIDSGAFAKVPDDANLYLARIKCVVSYPGSMSSIPWDAARYSPNVVFNCSDGSCGWCGDTYLEGRTLYESNCIHWKMDKAGNMTIDSFDDDISDAERDNLFSIYRDAQVVNLGWWETEDVRTVKINHANSIGNAFYVIGTDYDLPYLDTIEISSGLTSIKTQAFYSCSSLKGIYYNGTKSQWDSVTKNNGWDLLPSGCCLVHWRCTVSFDANGHGNAPASQANLWSNEDTASDPGNLSADDYIFTGWYTDQACNTKWDFHHEVPGDMILYAGWVEETAAAPTFSPEGGAYDTAQSVTLHSDTEGAEIYYTTNGTDPTSGSSCTKYSGAIPVTTTTTIKAIAVKSGMMDSEVASATYTISDGKTDPEITKAPAAIKGLVYKGKPQALITAGEVAGGTFYYAVTTDNTAPAASLYATSIPAATDVGTYHVWYKVDGDENHHDTAVCQTPVTVTVGKAPNPAAVEKTATLTMRGTLDLADCVSMNGATGALGCRITGGDNICTLAGSVLTAGEDTGYVTVEITVAEDIHYTALAARTLTVLVMPVEREIWIETIPDQDYTGAAVKPEVRVHYGKLLLTPADYTVSYARNTNAARRDQVKKSGQATVNDAPTVTVRGKGNYAGTATATYTIAPLDLAAAAEDGTALAAVSDIILAAGPRVQKGKPAVTYQLGDRTVKLVENRDYWLSYYKCDDGADPADPANYNTPCGQEEPKAPGTYRIRITGSGNYAYHTVPGDPESPVSFITCRQVIAQPEYIIPKAVLSAIPAQTYDPEGRAFVLEQAEVKNDGNTGTTRALVKKGTAYEPYAFTVKVNGKPLGYGTDYTLSYADNRDIGTATVTVTGTGDGVTGYTGSKTATFKINGTAMSTVRFDKDGGGKDTFTASLEYTGEPRKQEGAKLFRMNGQAKIPLVENTDYMVAYTDAKGNPCDPVEIGSYYAVYTGMGAYTGTVKKAYKITGRAMTNVKPDAADFSGSTGDDGTGKQYKDSWDAVQKGFIYTGLPFEVAGLDDLSGANAAATEAEKADNHGTGLTWTDPKNKGNTAALVKGTDYTVTYDKNVFPGTATVTFTGKGLYTGSFKKTFPIKAYSADETKNHLDAAMKGRLALVYVDPGNGARTAWSAAERSFPYTKGGVKPVPVVTYTYPATGGTPADLTMGTDFTDAWQRNNVLTTDAMGVNQKPAFTVTLKGAFTGKLTGGFTITNPTKDADHLNTSATVAATDVVYAERPGICKTTFTVTDDVTGMKLAAGVDYEPMAKAVYTYAEATSVWVKTGAKATDIDKTGSDRGAGAVVGANDIILPGTKIHATVAGKGIYAGSTFAQDFLFLDGNLATATVTVLPKGFTGEEIGLCTAADPANPDRPGQADITVKLGAKGEPLRCDDTCREYEIVPDSYVSNVNKGTAKVTIRGTRIHQAGTRCIGGTKTVTFQIQAKTMDYAIAYEKNFDRLLDLLCTEDFDPDAAELTGEQEREWYKEHYRIDGVMREQTVTAGGKLAKNTFRVQKKKANNQWAAAAAQGGRQILFDCWSVKANGGGEHYADAGTFSLSWVRNLLSGVFGGGYTLHAQWKVK